LWVSDLSYVATWQGFVYVGCVMDAFARRIVGWQVSRSARADFVSDALAQALYDSRTVRQGGLMHHGDRGVQYVSIRYTERLLGPIGNWPPAAAIVRYHAQADERAMVAWLKPDRLAQARRGSGAACR
jgi:hypothetical protein